MASHKVVLYSCIINNRDLPKIIEHRDDFEYVLFTDNPKLTAPGWEIRPLIWKDKDPTRTARYHKHNPFKIFPEAEYTIWLDATHWAIDTLVPFLTNTDLMVMKHFSRNSIKEEVKACSDANMDSSEIMNKQYEYYLSDGFEDVWGMYSTTCLIRKNSIELNNFQELWWDQICNFSKRDQLSFPYCLWKTNLKYDIIPGFCRIKPGSLFKMISHYKRFTRVMY